MNDYMLLESWGKPNVQTRKWLAQTFDDAEEIIVNEMVVSGDEVYVVEDQKTYVLDFTMTWQEKPSGGGTPEPPDPPDVPDDAVLFWSPEPFSMGVWNYSKNWDGTIYYSSDYYTWAEWDGSNRLTAVQDNDDYYKIYIRGENNTIITGYDGYYRRSWVFVGDKITCNGYLGNLLNYSGNINMGNYAFSYLFYYAQVNFDITLPENLTSNCYSYMFSYNNVLTSAPKLPATTLAYQCYLHMFAHCTSLKSAPELPATTLSESCYSNMFRGCTSLASAPELPATTLANSCYREMFAECASLISAPELSATTLYWGCYEYMFYDCSSLTSAPELPATTLANSCYNGMFTGCTSLTTAPELSATTLVDGCYNGMFRGCTSLISAPELPATTLAANCYSYMFFGCTFTSAPELPATTLASRCYSYMFSECTSLTSAPELPATTLTTNCYENMFNGCTSLTTIPELSATTLANYCYYQMFYKCSKIKLSTTQTGNYQNAYRIPTTGTGIDATNALNAMFSSTGGSFVGTPTINTTYYTSNTIIGGD